MHSLKEKDAPKIMAVHIKKGTSKKKLPLLPFLCRMRASRLAARSGEGRTPSPIPHTRSLLDYTSETRAALKKMQRKLRLSLPACTPLLSRVESTSTKHVLNLFPPYGVKRRPGHRPGGGGGQISTISSKPGPASVPRKLPPKRRD